MMKIVIANSVGRDIEGNYYIHFPSRWTARMGKIQDFSFYPYELAYLSSLLKRETDFEVKMVDGNRLGLNSDEYINLIALEKPQWLIMETASPVYDDDLKVARAMQKKFKTKVVFSGQHPTAFPKEVLNDGLDYVCLGEYEYTVLDIILGKKPKEILGLYPNPMRPPLDINSLPFPEDEDISRMDYDHIGGCDFREIEFFASRGCPFSCKFCVCGNLYYASPNWRPRKIESIIEEIKYLRKKYPQMEGIFFDEEDHLLNKKFIMDLTQAIIKNQLNDLKYEAMCGYIGIDKEMLKAMKKAGYYKLRIGIETASSQVAKMALGKRVDIDKLKEVLSYARQLGIKMYGTFTFGMMGATAEEDRKTLKLIKELLDKDLLYDYQRSISMPLPGTPFYYWAENNNLLLSKNWADFDGGTVVVNLPGYPKAELKSIYRECGQIFLKHQLKRKKWTLLKEQIQKRGLTETIKKSFFVLKDNFLPQSV
ncbi:radical SAM protein [Candidatus Gottesmanbacteria bacterium]|nr:radical SAM protein [Candidatus Gottesmanbacteria bacterium]